MKAFACVIVLCVAVIFHSEYVHASNTDIMSCVLCEMIAESVSTLNSPSPAAALSSMYKRCAHMGLMEPACDQIIDDNARRILGMAGLGTPPKNICRELNLCDH
uniref:Saposin B-type domain-containing protein n=1 Tax=Panagrellus redivivus TaxID=6233 RepID=A0A7E4V271_PANRE